MKPIPMGPSMTAFNVLLKEAGVIQLPPGLLRAIHVDDGHAAICRVIDIVMQKASNAYDEVRKENDALRERLRQLENKVTEMSIRLHYVPPNEWPR